MWTIWSLSNPNNYSVWAFPYWPDYHPETLILAQDAVEGQYGSRDDNQVNMEMPMYQTIKAFLYDQYDRKSTVHIFTPRENNRLLDYYKIISISRPILARANMGLNFVSGQYGCLFSRCNDYFQIVFIYSKQN
jgi:hypothetical protein